VELAELVNICLCRRSTRCTCNPRLRVMWAVKGASKYSFTIAQGRCLTSKRLVAVCRIGRLLSDEDQLASSGPVWLITSTVKAIWTTLTWNSHEAPKGPHANDDALLTSNPSCDYHVSVAARRLWRVRLQIFSTAAL
jgi:hypothetical protein